MGLIAGGFFDQLFSGMHGRNGVVTGEAFNPDDSNLKTYLLDLAQLSPRSRDALGRLATNLLG